MPPDFARVIGSGTWWTDGRGDHISNWRSLNHFSEAFVAASAKFSTRAAYSILFCYLKVGHHTAIPMKDVPFWNMGDSPG
eukprot:6210918-Pleurochrysis_carterae.AAC.3